MRRPPRLALPVLCVAMVTHFGRGALAAGDPLPTGGLLVHVGCGTGGRTVELVGQGEWLVHGLDGDWKNVEKAHKLIQAKALYGLVSVDRWAGRELPYADNIVNMLVAGERGSVSEEEVMRVLAPLGVARLGGKTIRGPRPKGMGEWPHRRHGADGNPVSRDTLVGPPREIRWVLGRGNYGLPLLADGKWYLAGVYTRDAFNGLPLWKSRLDVRAAGDGRLYGFAGGEVAALDSRTGERVCRFGPADAKSGTLLYLDGKLVVAARGEVRVQDTATGRARWSVKAGTPRHVVVGDGRVFFIDGDPKRGEECVAVCLDLATGKERWRTDTRAYFKKTSGCSYGGGVLVCEVSAFRDHGTCFVYAISGRDGMHLWTRGYRPSMGHNNQARAYFLGEDLWLHENGFTMLDRLTGEKKGWVPGGGGHCFPAIATVRYLMHGEMDFTDAKTGEVIANRITKGGCAENPFVPANGLIYTIPKHCICFPMLQGYCALAPASRTSGTSAWAGGGFDRGPAFGVSFAARPEKESQAEWPMYRHDRFRSGGSEGFVSARPRRLWSASVVGPKLSVGGMIWDDWQHHAYANDRITPPVAAGGRVFLAIPHEHRVVALEARSGRPLWTFTANGIIDLPPTIHRGLCLFGTRSGWVYCLVARDGRMVWRLRASPRDKRIVACGELESAWPVPGSVLAHEGIAYFAAGRTPLADGGVHVSAVRAATGRIVSRGVVDSVDIDRWYNRLGTDYEPVDLLVFDGEDRIAMSRARFTPRRASGPAQLRPAAQKRGLGVTVDASAGAFHQAGASGPWVPVGIWAYGRSMRRQRPKRYLYVFRGDTLYGSDGAVAAILPDKHPGGGGRHWTPFNYLNTLKKKWTGGVKGLRAMVATDKTLFAVDGGGNLTTFSTDKGVKLGSLGLGGACAWDGMAAAYGRLYVSMRDGRLICLGDPRMPPPPFPTRAPTSSSPQDRKGPPAKGTDDAAEPAGDPARRAVERREGDGREKGAPVGKKTPGAKAIAAWDAKLLARVMVKHAAAAGEIAEAWPGLSLDDKASLALSVAGDDEAGHALAAFYLIAAGKEAEAGEHLRKAGAAAEAVRAAFK